MFELYLLEDVQRLF